MRPPPSCEVGAWEERVFQIYLRKLYIHTSGEKFIHLTRWDRPERITPVPLAVCVFWGVSRELIAKTRALDRGSGAPEFEFDDV